MKTVIFLGKRTKPGSPKAKWPGAELWGTTHSFTKYLKQFGPINDWDSWWDLHPFDPVPGYDGIKKRRPKTYQWYRTLPAEGEPGYRPLWLAELDPTIPAGKLFPKHQILEELKVPPETRRWFTCQVDLMMAYALVQGYQHIVLHGHGTKFEPTHMVDHCGVLVWMTLARERGVKVTILPPSWYLGPNKPYGISMDGWAKLHHR